MNSAFRMQNASPEAVDLSTRDVRTQVTLRGLDDPKTDEFGTRCLLARRLVERGVRFVQLYSGGGPVSDQWDVTTTSMPTTKRCADYGQTRLGALTHGPQENADYFEETLVVWGGEFGRTPVRQSGGRGRDHNDHRLYHLDGGGGVNRANGRGATDEDRSQWPSRLVPMSMISMPRSSI